MAFLEYNDRMDDIYRQAARLEKMSPIEALNWLNAYPEIIDFLSSSQIDMYNRYSREYYIPVHKLNLLRGVISLDKQSRYQSMLHKVPVGEPITNNRIKVDNLIAYYYQR